MKVLKKSKKHKKPLGAKLQEELNQLCSEFKEIQFDKDTWKFLLATKKFFEASILNLDNNHFEAGFLCFCSIIEGVSSKLYSGGYSNFFDWLITHEGKVNFEDIGDKGKYKTEIKKLFEVYLQTYGIRRNFIKTISKAYLDNNVLPSNVKMKSKREKGRTTWTLRPLSEFKDANKLITGFKKDLGKLYDNYRCPITHEAKLIDPMVSMCTRFEWDMTPTESPSLQALGYMTLQVMKHYFNKWKINKG